MAVAPSQYAPQAASAEAAAAESAFGDETSQAQDRYTDLLHGTHQRLIIDGRLWNRLGWARGLLFLATVAAAFSGWQSLGGRSAAWWLLAGLLLLAFLVFAALQTAVEQRLGRDHSLLALLNAARSRCQRNWRQLDADEARPDGYSDRLTEDLDLLGYASVFQLLGSAHTPVGRQKLLRWMLHPAKPAQVLDRQAAVKRLAQMPDWRLELERVSHMIRFGTSDLARFQRWSIEGWSIPYLRALVWVARGSAVAFIALPVAWATGGLPAGVAFAGLAGVVALNFLLSVVTGGAIHDAFRQVAARLHDFSLYRDLLAMTRQLPQDAELLRRLRDRVHPPTEGALEATGRLARLVWLAEMRRHGLLFLVYLALQMALMWDAHVLALLDRWRRRYGARVPRWLEAAGEIEALSALATLAADHPSWAFPTFDDSPGAPAVQASGLGHPLLPGTRRVANDVQIGPPGTFLLVTGSNMSGKSTLLRSIGVNVLLAQMGSVVCARQMSLIPLQVQTSVRKGDSLAEGVSLFMAELQRLHDIVRASESPRGENGRPVLFLLDEVLLGTNSRERHIAVAHVVHRLLQAGAAGVVTTHDAELAQHDSLRRACRCVHFTETFITQGDRRSMTFDYRLRPGLATSTNALKLLALVGLSEFPEEMGDSPAGSNANSGSGLPAGRHSLPGQ